MASGSAPVGDRSGGDWNNIRGLVFTTRTGRPVSQRNISRAFNRARNAAGIDHGSLKTLRSTVATQLADAGLHPCKIQTLFGHAHVTTAMTFYTAVTDLVDAAALLPDLDEVVR